MMSANAAKTTCCVRRHHGSLLSSGVRVLPIRTEQLVELRHDTVELALELRVALLRITADPLIGLIRHSIQVGDVRLQPRCAVPNRRRDEPRLESLHLRQGIRARAAAATQSSA